MNEKKHPHVITIDCHYEGEQVAAAFLIVAGKNSCLIETNTNYAIAHIENAMRDAGLSPDDICAIIITHVHLDHAGGAGLAMQNFPRAKLYAHPRAEKHMVDPSRLVESARSVYGAEKFEKLYGTILPVSAERVVVPEDGAIVDLGNYRAQFIYTRGHANHHFVIVIPELEAVFTGDSFGLAYPCLQKGSKPFIFPTTTPTDFDAELALASYDLIAHCGARTAYLTHFGAYADLEGGSQMLKTYLLEYREYFDHVKMSDYDNTSAYAWMKKKLQEFFAREISARGLQLSSDENRILDLDIDLNAQGIVFSALRARQKKTAE